MSWLKDTFSSSLGRKYIMALSGGFLIVFLLIHLAGNLLLLLDDGGDAFNLYAHFMATHWYISPVGEVVLFGGFIAHIVDGISLAIKNKKARPVGYGYKGGGHKKVTWISKNMKGLGIVLLVFLIIHLGDFWLKSRFLSSDPNIVPTVTIDGQDYHNAYQLCVNTFSIWWWTVIYVISMIVVGLHLQHGFQSAFQSMGWRHVKYTPLFQKLGTIYAIVVPATFAAIPIYFLLK